ncbi:MarR family winged helix-turn-helix transcriptional regulator [Streptomyces sp. NPDC056045]|uniref:MarR family winged helix-turn-helix transcriptional regulator n=1 Tax=Streptomyces sp. NPDC056045 TaxID=3345691 RepID=UPI0035E1F777
MNPTASPPEPRPSKTSSQRNQPATRQALSAREYSLLDVLSRRHDGEGGHLQMRQVADSVVLGRSATTRLEDRGLLSRHLCPTDRRGICTDVTDDGLRLLEEARPTHETALCEALDRAAADPASAPLVRAVQHLRSETRPA